MSKWVVVYYMFWIAISFIIGAEIGFIAGWWFTK